jgi:hypothetical protein
LLWFQVIQGHFPGRAQKNRDKPWVLVGPAETRAQVCSKLIGMGCVVAVCGDSAVWAVWLLFVVITLYGLCGCCLW